MAAQTGTTTYDALGVDVANVGSDTCVGVLVSLSSIGCEVRTGTAADVVQRELRDTRVELEQQRQGLANATGSTEDGDLGVLHSKRQD